MRGGVLYRYGGIIFVRMGVVLRVLGRDEVAIVDS